MKKFLFVLILITGISTNFLTAQIKAYPSHWWTGMKHNSLQVMLHSTVDLSKSVKVKYPGVVVTKVHQPENKHYLFVDLLLLPTVKAGKFDFVLDDGLHEFRSNITSLITFWPYLKKSGLIKQCKVQNKSWLWMNGMHKTE